MTGTTPPGAASERDAAEWVRAMFSRVAHRYDLLNHLLSFNLDRYWRAKTAERVAYVLRRPGARVVDICCGTGDLMLALEAVINIAGVMGLIPLKGLALPFLSYGGTSLIMSLVAVGILLNISAYES